MKILTIVGARPQFVKAAVVSRVISAINNNKPGDIQEVIVHTGQHYDNFMSDIFFEEMHIPPPAYSLGLGRGSHGQMTGQMLEQIEKVIVAEKPDLVLVYGDTNSTLAGALAAVKVHVPVAHVEAGLRSFNMQMPEEINRVLTDRISRWLFCPTEAAVRNLLGEGAERWPNAQIYNVGDVMYDATLFYLKKAMASKNIAGLLQSFRDGFYLATVHRQENTDNLQRLKSIVAALKKIAERVPVVMPLHPRTRNSLSKAGLDLQAVTAIEPVGYFDMMCLLKNCKAVFTDSGGVQKEAYFFHKPCITLRDETEWVELVEHGYNYLAGAVTENIICAEEKFVKQKRSFSMPLYGDGQAGKEIVDILLNA